MVLEVSWFTRLYFLIGFGTGTSADSKLLLKDVLGHSVRNCSCCFLWINYKLISRKLWKKMVFFVSFHGFCMDEYPQALFGSLFLGILRPHQLAISPQPPLHGHITHDYPITAQSLLPLPQIKTPPCLLYPSQNPPPLPSAYLPHKSQPRGREKKKK